MMNFELFYVTLSFVSLITALCLFKVDIIDLSFLCFTRTLHKHTEIFSIPT